MESWKFLKDTTNEMEKLVQTSSIEGVKQTSDLDDFFEQGIW
jgi:hypothetical protein